MVEYLPYQETYDKVCSICGNKFETVYIRQNICSFDCRQEAGRERSRRLMRIKRNKIRQYPPCVGCGYTKITECHHEGYKGTYDLCPNCHSLITRGIKTLEQVLKG